MAAGLRELDTSYETFTVVLDGHTEREDSLRYWLDNLYGGEKEHFLFLRGENPSGEELYRILKEKDRNLDIELPSDARLQICFYLPLSSLTPEWTEYFFRMAEDLGRFITVTSITHCRYLLCFSYETSMPLHKGKKEILHRLTELAPHPDEQPERKMISRQVFLLRTAAFETFDSQEHALAALLHIRSRKGSYVALPPAVPFDSYLKMLSYSDYYENAASQCRQKIEKISEWLEGEADPGLDRTAEYLADLLQPSCRELRREAENFRKRQSLFPVSTSEYRGNPVTGYRRAYDESSPMLKKRMTEAIDGVRKKLEKKTDPSAFLSYVTENLDRRDILDLQRKIDSGELEEKVFRLLEGSESRKAAGAADVQREELRQLCADVFLLLKPGADRIFSELEEKEKEKQRERKRLKRRLHEDQYKSIRECLGKMNEDTKRDPVEGKLPENILSVGLVSGECADSWGIENYEMKGVRNVFAYPAIAPNEAALLKMFDMIDLNREDTEKILDRWF